MPDRSNKLYIHFGGMCPQLSEQLAKYNVPNDDKMHVLQVMADSIARLHVTGLLTESEAHKARMRMMKRIAAAIKEHGHD